MKQPIVINEANIDKTLIDNVFLEKNIPESSSFIIILSEGMLEGNPLGICLPRKLINFYNGMKIFSHYEKQEWDFGIFISGEACESAKDYPAYFTYLLAHELCHAHIYFIDKIYHIKGSSLRLTFD